MKNIVLTGMMGVGKSAVGRMLARELNMHFVDMDAQIEALLGMPIRDIYKKHGTIRLHSEEALIISKLKNRENLVIATGENTLMQDANYEILAWNSVIFLLNASAETVYARICRKNNRSLLPKGAGLETVRQIMAEHDPEYRARSHHAVTVDTKNLDEVVADIIACYKEHIE